MVETAELGAPGGIEERGDLFAARQAIDFGEQGLGVFGQAAVDDEHLIRAFGKYHVGTSALDQRQARGQRRALQLALCAKAQRGRQRAGSQGSKNVSACRFHARPTGVFTRFDPGCSKKLRKKRGAILQPATWQAGKAPQLTRSDALWYVPGSVCH